jgi:hypothetical protein
MRLIGAPIFAIFSPPGESMTTSARAALESALRARKLDRTLTTSLPSLEPPDAVAVAPTAIEQLDACLKGGLPRGQLSELAGPRSSGRTAVCLQLMAAATRRGELVALVDASDRLDVASAASAGVDLARLLWVRGQSSDRVHATPGRDLLERAVDRALKALALVLQAGGFGVVVLDLADVPPGALARLPFTTWLRLQRAVEGRDTACVLVVPAPVARSAGGLTLVLRGRAGWSGAAARSRRLQRVDIQARVISPRRRVEGDLEVAAMARE